MTNEKHHLKFDVRHSNFVISSLRFQNRFSHHFVQRCCSIGGEGQPRVAERDHSKVDCDLAELVDRGVLHHHFPQLVVHNHQLKEADPPLVTGVVAHVAATAVVELAAVEL